MDADAFLLAALVGVLSTFAGGASQRATGIGLALIATPGLVLTLGPVEGVTMMIICGSTGAGVAALTVLRLVDWRMFAIVTLAGAAFSPVGAWVVLHLDAVVIQLCLAGLIASALLVPLLARRLRFRHPSPVAATVTGATLGFVNSAAGVGGPALVAYAVASDWPFDRFRATAQPVFWAAGVSSILSRLIVGDGTSAHVDLRLAAILVASTLAGVTVGGALSRRLPIPLVRRISVGIALTGAAVVGADALVRLLAR